MSQKLKLDDDEEEAGPGAHLCEREPSSSSSSVGWLVGRHRGNTLIAQLFAVVVSPNKDTYWQSCTSYHAANSRIMERKCIPIPDTHINFIGSMNL